MTLLCVCDIQMSFRVMFVCLCSLFFQQSSYPVWEDFCAKATKLHSQLRWGQILSPVKETCCVSAAGAVNKRWCVSRTTILAAVAFLDAFQKVADMATNSRGKAFVFKSQSSVFKRYICVSKQ